MRHILRPLLLSLSALALSTAPAMAADSPCCTVEQTSATKVVLNCPALGAKAQVRMEGARGAALVRFSEAFGETDVGTYFEKNEVAVVTTTIAAAPGPRSIVLNAFINESGALNWLLSYKTKSGRTVAQSNLRESEGTCEQTPQVISISETELPPGYATVSASETVSPPELVLGRLFGM